RWCEVCERGDWEALSALYAEDAVLDERRPLVRMTGGRDALVKNARYLWETSGGRLTRTLLAVAGDRHALELNHWCAREGVPDFEVDILLLIEVDDQGRFARITGFDPADRVAANAEMVARSMATPQNGDAPAASLRIPPNA